MTGSTAQPTNSATFDLGLVLTPECTRTGVAVSSRKKLLETASELLSDHFPRLDAHALFDALMARERLGSTGLGAGVAIPHCRVPGLRVETGALFRLAEPVSFDAVDSAPVDLVFALVVPENDNQSHLQTLAALARGFSSDEIRHELRAAQSDWDLYRCALDRFRGSQAS